MTHKLAYWILAGLIISFSTTSYSSTEKALEVKTLPSINFFYGEYTLSNESMQKQGDKIAEKTAYTIATKTPTVLDGPFTYIFENVQSFDPKTLTAQIGWQVEKEIQGVDSYLFKKTMRFKCITAVYEGPHSELPHAWKKLVTQAVGEGHKITGEGRTLIKLSGANGYVVTELQLGVQ